MSKRFPFPKNRMARLSAFAVVLSAVAAMALAAFSASGAPSSVSVTVLGYGTLDSRVNVFNRGTRIKARAQRIVVTAAASVEPGGTFGWHRHPGPVLVVVKSGTLTLYHARGRRCKRQRFGPGKSFAEPGPDAHLARNEGTTPVELVATLIIPRGANLQSDAQQPRRCRL